MLTQAAIRLIRIVQIAMLASVIVYAAGGEFLFHKPGTDPANTLFHALSFISISLVGATIVVRRTLVIPSEELLRHRQDDGLAVARWRTGYIFLYSLCEVLGVFGFILRMAGFPLANVWGFYLGAVLLLLIYSPRNPRPVYAR